MTAPGWRPSYRTNPDPGMSGGSTTPYAPFTKCRDGAAALGSGLAHPGLMLVSRVAAESWLLIDSPTGPRAGPDHTSPLRDTADRVVGPVAVDLFVRVC